MTNELPVEELEQDLDLELEDDGEEVVTVPKKTLQTLQAQKEHWKNKANKPVEKEKPSVVDTPKPQTNQAEDIDKRLEKIELKTEGYSDDEIVFIQSNGGKKALENTYVKTAIQTIREQRKAEQATVEADSAKSDIEKKYSASQLKSMSAEELRKILPKADN